MKKFRSLLIICVVLAVAALVIITVPNPVQSAVLSKAKANGYLEYSPEEAVALARKICTQCHSDERIKMYCPRCGPPFVAVVPHMQVFIDNYSTTRPNIHFENITEHQAVAIVQVWNALVGNWEKDFREQDVLKLIGHYDQLVALLKTPVEKRRIEYALTKRDDLKIGHMTGLNDAQKNLGGRGNNPKPGEKPVMGHSDHMNEKHDHSEHEMHNNMEHDKY